MKKTLLALILALIFVLSFTLCVSAADTKESPESTGSVILLGDVDGDGKVTNADVLMIYRYIYSPELYPLPTLCNHSYGEWTVIEPATCAADGEMVRICEKCDKTEETTVKGGHVYEETVVPPTSTDDGYTGYTCKRCGNSYKDNRVPALGFTSNFTYTKNPDGKTCTVTGLVDETVTSVEIPESIDGYTVTAIGRKAFEDKTSITEIFIPDTVETIGARAFYGCTGITEITIPESVTDIGTQIFYNASNLSKVYYNSSYASSDNPFLSPSHIKTVVFGGSEVPSYILNGYTNITEVIISDGVEYIGDYAFYGCTSLESIDIPDSVTSIGSSAFSDCTSLLSITIPDSVTYIGLSAFYNCTSLESIEIPDSVTIIGDFMFYNCTSLASIEIPNSVMSISYSAFYGCTLLDSVTIPDSVANIGSFAFYNCTSLEGIEIPDSVTVIGSGAFYGCTSLESIEIPDSVTVIESKTFYSCTSLESITIPDSVTDIGDCAFYGCTSIKSVYITDIDAWLNISFEGYSSNPCYCGADLYLNGVKVNLAYDGALGLINRIFTSYNANATEDTMLYVAGGNIYNFDTVSFDSPAAFIPLADTDYDDNLGVPVAEVANLESAASMFNTMNANVFNCYTLQFKSGTDVDASINAIKENIIDRQWMMGAPDKLVIVKLPDNFIMVVWGAVESGGLVNPFVEHTVAEVDGATIVVEYIFEF